jgi:acetyl esterase/lipase
MVSHRGRAARRRSWSVERLEGRTLLSAAASHVHIDSYVHALGHRRGHDRGRLAGEPPAREAANLVYENVGGRQELLDVYWPQGTPPPGGWPVLLAIHGGGWRNFGKDDYGPKIAAEFNPHGIAVVAMNYQLSARGVPSWPANFEDVRNAVRWTRSNAPAFGLDPTRFAAIGESAGGHLAALLGTNPDGPVTAGGDPAAGDAFPGVSARIQGVVDFYGPTNLAALDAESPLAGLAIEQFLGGKPGQVPQSYADASPVTHVTGASPAMLILQGTADDLITADQPRALAAALSAVGVANRVIEVPGAPHGFEFQPSGQKLDPAVLAFLHSVWPG